MTPDTERAARKVVTLAPRLARDGIMVTGVRLDSGDLGAYARAVRTILDQSGLREVRIFVSGGLDERAIRTLEVTAPVDGYGVGTELSTSGDVPALDCAYKPQSYAGMPKRKRSEGKATWPGRKQVYRRIGADGRLAGDTLTVGGDEQLGEPLLHAVMQGGQRLRPPPALAECRTLAAAEISRLPDRLGGLGPA
jgi:nicotinate phosphoribosyltransferase